MKIQTASKFLFTDFNRWYTFYCTKRIGRLTLKHPLTSRMHEGRWNILKKCRGDFEIYNILSLSEHWFPIGQNYVIFINSFVKFTSNFLLLFQYWTKYHLSNGKCSETTVWAKKKNWGPLWTFHWMF